MKLESIYEIKTYWKKNICYQVTCEFEVSGNNKHSSVSKTWLVVDQVVLDDGLQALLLLSYLPAAGDFGGVT